MKKVKDTQEIIKDVYELMEGSIFLSPQNGVGELGQEFKEMWVKKHPDLDPVSTVDFSFDGVLLVSKAIDNMLDSGEDPTDFNTTNSFLRKATTIGATGKIKINT